MTASPSASNAVGRLNRFDLQLWNRFVAIAQPYWYPTGRGSGKIFFLLLLSLLIFLFAILVVIVSAATLALNHFFPAVMAETAGGLVSLVQLFTSKPGMAGIAAAFIIPAIAFYLARNQVVPRWPQWVFLGVLLLLLLCVSGMNVVISFGGNYFTTALAKKESATFWRYFFVYAGIFAIATPFVVYYNYVQSLLGLRWREWMTQRFLKRYFQNRAYYEINSNEDIDNPDQRIAQDINSFTVTSLSFLLIILGSVIDVLSFSGILWSLSKFLAVFLIGYAIVGTWIVTVWGKKLIALNFNQLRQEANFRYGLVHVRDNAESIAFYQGEGQEQGQLLRRFVEVLRNFNFLIGWQRNLAFFRTPYRYATYILPYVILAPRYFAGEIEFGDMTQANFAFGQIFEAFAILVSQINQLSEFAAGINRLETFVEALDDESAALAPGQTAIDTVEDGRIALEHITLLTPKGQRTLVSDLSATVSAGQGLVIVGHSGAGKSSLLRAIAGLWDNGTGRIVRPSLADMMFLPQRPYMVLGTLREQLMYPTTDRDVTEAELCSALAQVNLEELPKRLGGFDAELDWDDILSLGEQQRLAFARLLLSQPRYAILDEATSALDLTNERSLYTQLKAKGITFVSVGHRPSLLEYHDYVLELTGDTSWRLIPTADYQLNVQSFS
ncbi:MAG TPA: ABC transporter ATP-binding protein/permease [Chroococcidiopsis sp.]